jgi:hypothetical protein
MLINVMKRHGGFENSISIRPQQNREIYIKFDHVRKDEDLHEIVFATAAGGIVATIHDPEWYQPIIDELEAAGL